MESVWIGIGINITPSDIGYEELLRLNKRLVVQYGSSYIFDPVSNQPHINLYDLNVPEKNLIQIETELKKIADNFKEFFVDLKEISYFDHGTIFISCEINDQLIKLEKQIVESISLLKDDCKTLEYWQSWREYNTKQVENRDKYGNPHVLDTFVPHLTVGFIKGTKDELDKVVEEVGGQLMINKINCGQIDLVVHNKQGELISSQRFHMRKD